MALHTIDRQLLLPLLINKENNRLLYHFNAFLPGFRFYCELKYSKCEPHRASDSTSRAKEGRYFCYKSFCNSIFCPVYNKCIRARKHSENCNSLSHVVVVGLIFIFLLILRIAKIYNIERNDENLIKY
jgi:hypothetical protein